MLKMRSPRNHLARDRQMPCSQQRRDRSDQPENQLHTSVTSFRFGVGPGFRYWNGRVAPLRYCIRWWLRFSPAGGSFILFSSCVWCRLFVSGVYRRAALGRPGTISGCACSGHDQISSVAATTVASAAARSADPMTGALPERSRREVSVRRRATMTK
jgi:hypothetical protein